MELTSSDRRDALHRLPERLLEIMRRPEWKERIFVAGGCILSTVTDDTINDIDIFVRGPEDAVALATALSGLSPEQYMAPMLRAKAGILVTENAITLKEFSPAIQIISRWSFPSAQDAANSFDFSICCAAIWFGDKIEKDGNGEQYVRLDWCSYCDAGFYPDAAARRLVYRAPKRSESAAGSMLRVLKFVRRGYRIESEQLAAVLGRLFASENELLVTDHDTHERQATNRIAELFNQSSAPTVEKPQLQMKIAEVKAPNYAGRRSSNY